MSATTNGAHALAGYRAEFPIFEKKRYLNTCSLGPLGVRSRERVNEYLDVWEARGAAAWYDVWWEALAELRARYAGVIAAESSEIALHASVSTATAVLASALDYTGRSKIVTTSLDFPTVAYQWLAKHEAGIDLEIVESPDGIGVPIDLLASAVDERTALVATSHVFFTSGCIQDVRAVADIAHAKGALCYVDAYQSVGQVPLAIHDTEVDFLSAGGLKWLLGGSGIVFLYVRDGLCRDLTPTVTGWFAQSDIFAMNTSSYDPAPNARRFEMGTPPVPNCYAAEAGLNILARIGMPAIEARIAELTEAIIREAQAAGYSLAVPTEPGKHGAMITIRTHDEVALVAALEDQGIVTSGRFNNLRIAPHFYNDFDDIDTLFGALHKHRHLLV